jgi:MFS family permease
MAEQAPGYVYTAYIFSYGTAVLGQSRDFLLAALIVCTALAFMWVPVAGHLSDRFGRRRFYIFGGVFSGLFGFLYFALLDTGSPLWIFVAISLSLIPVMTLYGPQAALIAEAFSPRLPTAALASAISLPRSSRAARRRLSPRRCSRPIIREWRSRATCWPAV